MNSSIKSYLEALTIIFLISAVIFVSCESQEAANAEAQELFLSEQVQNQEFDNLSVVQQHNTLLLEGDFKVATPKNDQLLIYTETLEHRHIFFIKGIKKALVKDLTIEKLYHLQHGILINENLFLGVNGNVSANMKKDLIVLAKNNTYKTHINASILLHKWYAKTDADFKNSSPDELIAKTAREGYDSIGH